MGYTTDFGGSFDTTIPLRPEHSAYLKALNGTRRMKRDAAIAETFPDPIRIAAGLPIGPEGAYYVGSPDGEGWDCRGQARDASVLDYNTPPAGQPGLWCGWTVDGFDAGIEWDGGENFYRYIDWLKYLIEHFLAPWGYTLDGEVYWDGEGSEDFGKIIVKDNVVTAKKGRIVYDVDVEVG